MPYAFFAFEIIRDWRLKKTEDHVVVASCRENAWQQAIRPLRKGSYISIINLRQITKEEYDAIAASTPADRMGYYPSPWHPSADKSSIAMKMPLWPAPDEWARHRRFSQQEYDAMTASTLANANRYCQSD